MLLLQMPVLNHFLRIKEVIVNTNTFRFNLKSSDQILNKNMKNKTLEQYCNLSVAIKFGLVLLVLNLCYPAQVCSKNIVPLSFLGRTTGRINNHMLDKLINLYQKGKKRSLYIKNRKSLSVLKM